MNEALFVLEVLLEIVRIPEAGCIILILTCLPCKLLEITIHWYLGVGVNIALALVAQPRRRVTCMCKSLARLDAFKRVLSLSRHVEVGD